MSYPSESLEPWEYPDCPECGSNVFVSGSTSDYFLWLCNSCDKRFGEAG